MAERYKLSAQLKFNIKSHLEREFINKGLYFNIASGMYDVSGERADILTRVNGQLYESFFDEWIYETDASGVGGFNTVTVSGVYVDSVFQARGSSPYEPFIDYRNGRVGFNGTEVPAGSEVLAEFSYKHGRVDFVKSNAVNLLFSQVKDNVDFTQNAVPSGLERQLPLVVIDLQRRDPAPWSIGGGTQWDQLVVFHILSNSTHELDQIVDILTEDSFRKVIQAADFNSVPELFTYQGDIADTYENFTQLQSNYPWNKMYVDEATLIEESELFGLQFARVHWTVKIIKSGVV
jgi:hypothetical protein